MYISIYTQGSALTNWKLDLKIEAFRWLDLCQEIEKWDGGPEGLDRYWMTQIIQDLYQLVVCVRTWLWLTYWLSLYLDNFVILFVIGYNNRV